MPQATAELQTWATRKFGSLSDAGPIKLLEQAGYTLLPTWHWYPPDNIQNYGDMGDDEWMAMIFLIQEWDFGGLHEPRNVA